jgi:hypothetical protein
MNKKKLFLKSKRQPVLVLDKYGRVRLSLDNATIINGSPDEVADKVTTALNQHKASGKDLAPQVHILDGIKLMDFSSLTAPDHVAKAVRNELKKASAADVAAIIKIT